MKYQFLIVEVSTRIIGICDLKYLCLLVPEDTVHLSHMGTNPGGVDNGSRSTSYHWIVNQETEGNYSGKVVLPPHI